MSLLFPVIICWKTENKVFPLQTFKHTKRAPSFIRKFFAIKCDSKVFKKSSSNLVVAFFYFFPCYSLFLLLKTLVLFLFFFFKNRIINQPKGNKKTKTYFKYRKEKFGKQIIQKNLKKNPTKLFKKMI